MCYNVFISHHHDRDGAVADCVATRLKGEFGLECWIAEQGLRAGEVWLEAIPKAILNSDYFAILLSGELTHFMQAELLSAIEHEKPILPIQVSSVDNQATAFALGPIQVVNGMRLGEDEKTVCRTTAGDIAEVVCDSRETAQPPHCFISKNMPRENAFFIGRENDLKSLERLKGDANTGFKKAAIVGPPGIGKSALAIQYAYQNQDSYKKILYASAHNREVLLRDYRFLAHELELPVGDFSDLEATRIAVIRWLETTSDWLLILDNLEPQQVADSSVASALMWVTSFWPNAEAERGNVLVTSRRREFQELEPIATLEVAKLPLDLAQQYLLKRTGSYEKEGMQEAARDIVKRVDCHPLSLEFVIRGVNKENQDLQRFLENLEDDDDVILRALVEKWSPDFERAEQQSKASGEILRICAFLNPNRIPLELLCQVAQEPRKDPDDMWRDSPISSFSIRVALFPLWQSGLVDVQEDSCSFHAHVLETVLAYLREKGELSGCLNRTVLAFNDTLPNPIHFEDWAFCGLLVPHAVALADHVEDSLGVKCKEEAGQLFNQVGYYLSKRAEYSTAERLYNLALKFRQNTLEADHPDVAQTMFNLGLLFYDQGKYVDAEPMLEQALKIRRSTLPPTDPEIARSLVAWADLKRIQQEAGEAEESYKRALETLSVNDPTRLYTKQGLAVLYIDCNRQAEAERLFEEVLDETLELLTTKALLETNDPNTARSHDNLGYLYLALRRFDEAEKHLKAACELREDILGARHPRTAESLCKLASCYQIQYMESRRSSWFEEAESNYLRASRAWEKTFGNRHPDLVRCYADLARLYQTAELREKTMEYHQRALDGCDNIEAFSFFDDDAVSRLRKDIHRDLDGMI